MRISITLALFLSAMVTSSTLADAAQHGSVSGTIRDANGNPVVGLQLRLEQAMRLHGCVVSTKTIARTTTDSEGRFCFTGIGPGDYLLIGGNKRIGWIFMPLTVETNRELELHDIHLHNGR